jgi:predicted dehydrogenase
MPPDSAHPIRLGIVGCGAVAQLCHLKALDSLPQFEVRYLCDRNPATARTAKSTYGLRAELTERVQDLAGNVDAAIVCVWPRFHRPITLELLDLGIDVLCEKPVATSSPDAEAIAEAARQAARIVAIGQWCRCQKNMWILRKLLSLDYLGEIQQVTAAFGNPLSWPMSTGAYFDRELTAGGVMFDAGIHVIDLVVWLFGDIANVEYQDDSYGGVEANGVIRGTLNIGNRPVPCSVSASWTHGMRNGIRVTGSKGEAEAGFTQRDVVILQQQVGNERIRSLIPADRFAIPFQSSNPYAAQLEDFATSVRSRNAPITPVDTTILPLKVVEAAYKVRQPMPQPWVEVPRETACTTQRS